MPPVTPHSLNFLQCHSLNFLQSINDSQWDALKMLAEEATKEYYQQQQQRRRSSISNVKKMTKIHQASMKSTKNSIAADDEALKSYDFAKAETSGSKKPIDLDSKEPIKSIDYASKGSNLHLPPKKRLKFIANYVLKEEASSEKPVTFMGSAIEGAEHTDLKEDDHVLRMKKGKDLKRTCGTFINDAENADVVDDQEWVPGESSKTKEKRKKTELTKEQLQLLDQAIAEAPTVLPQEFINRINEMGGNEITLVITKYLYITDLSPQHMRLSMPLKQIKNAGFLREGEKQVLERDTIPVVLLQPSLEPTNLVLAKWYAKAKHDGSRNACYILRTNWMDVVRANDLQKYGVVQVWSFRVQEKLHMALVKLPNVIL
ncbi:hypothetical protein RIF29_03543 [Crotalaria pallida]|uniref:Uncharacterized protein n=1 Tax=Crotalaria pallida TaxID=3830 RepID=A0AAN9J019_CROPI